MSHSFQKRRRRRDSGRCRTILTADSTTIESFLTNTNPRTVVRTDFFGWLGNIGGRLLTFISVARIAAKQLYSASDGAREKGSSGGPYRWMAEGCPANGL
ncbi:hypothetical protein CRI94_10900 [Longibacter salinarum]|uniref:Uncharacterized protein n=1 Tax=Longibacter salinarum TaxID=1850348 RepID=A0A2A8CX51_9BACT|nr:hypothetical protein CRI94_10900 [Longibacter salinarum]